MQGRGGTPSGLKSAGISQSFRDPSRLSQFARVAAYAERKVKPSFEYGGAVRITDDRFYTSRKTLAKIICTPQANMTPLGKLLAFSYIAFCVFTFCQPFGNLCRKMKYFHVKCRSGSLHCEDTNNFGICHFPVCAIVT